MDARFQIRPATERDLPAIAGLERVCFPDPWSEESFRSLMRGHARVVDDAGSVVAYGFARHAADTGEILNVAVAPAYRRSGIARALVHDLCVALAGVGVEEVFLEVRESNGPAQALYRAAGFAPVGRRPRYYHHPVEDALLLRRHLAQEGNRVSEGS